MNFSRSALSSEGLSRRLRWLADNASDVCALRFRGASLTYGDIDRELAALGEALEHEAGARTLMVLPDSPVAYLFHLSCFIRGVTLIPQSPTTPVRRLAELVARVKPQLVVTSPALIEKYAGIGFDCPVLLVGEADDPSSLEWKHEQRRSSRDAAVPGDVRVLLFTSGSTGAPKGVCLGERSITSAAAINLDILSLSEARRSLLTVPLFDYYGLIQIYTHVLAGAELIIGESVAFMTRILDQARAASITDLVAVPYGLRRIFGNVSPTETDAFASLAIVTSSSEPLTADVQRLIFSACPSVEIVDIYGLTEAGRACSRRLRQPSPDVGFVGRASPGMTFTGGRSAESPEELFINGSTLMLGYMTGVAASGEIRYQAVERVGTGDLGYVDTDGSVIILGRHDHMINLRGDKIHPAEIESAALEIVGVSDARARLEPGPEPELLLEVVTDDDDLDADELRRLLSERLPLQFTPRRIERVNTIARTELGSKIVRR